MEIPLSSLITFLSGVAVGAAGQYFADKYTDQRRKQEAERAKSKLFRRVEAEMPSLIAEMKEDFSKSEHSSYREFVVTRRSLMVRPIPACLGYYEEEHPRIRGFATVLENNGLIRAISEDEPKRYRFQEDFVEWLKKQT